MPAFTGRLLGPDDVLEGTLEVQGGRVVSWREGERDRNAVADGWIVPAPINAHTHAADTFARDLPDKPRTVPDLVGPGGWKSRQLAKASPDQVAAGIRRYAQEMADIGTVRFVDFREGGLEGVRLLKALAPELPVAPLVLGRPLHRGFDPEEAASLLAEADGIGLSARRDFADPTHVEDWAEATHRARKPFALHASEAAAEDVEAVLALEPTFLVHLSRASDRDLRAVADAGVPVVVCPRSNAYYGLKSPLDRLRAAGVTVSVGSDNGMINSGDVRADLGLLAGWFPATPTADLLRMVSWNPRAFVGPPPRFPPRPGDAADFVVLPEPFLPDRSHRPGWTS